MTARDLSILPRETRIRLQESGALVTQGHRDFLASRAPSISINRYWDLTGLGFELSNLPNISLHPHIERFLDVVADPQRSIFEAGCGIGRTYDVLRQRGFTNYLGIDICRSSIEEASARYPKAAFVHENLLSYAPPHIFDSAIATDIMQYFSPLNQVRALLGLRGILNPLDQAAAPLVNPHRPMLLRWAAGNNTVDYKSKIIEGDTVEGWVFLVDEPYLRQLLYVTGFSPMYLEKEEITLTGGRVIPYHIAIAEALPQEN